MKILVTGGTGFIGKPLCATLLQKGHQLSVLTRDRRRAQSLLSRDIQLIESLQEISSLSFEAVINLAGAPIAERWTPAYKEILIKSRTDLTNQLVSTFKQWSSPPKVFISGSAIGYYGAQGDEALSESSPFQPGFSHELCAAWENSAMKATEQGVRVCCLRTGVVLGRHGGALSRMRYPFLCCLGGPIGQGNQWMSWIELMDMIQVIVFCLENTGIKGPVNATSPLPVRNQEFARIYSEVLHRPHFLTMPSLPLKILFGEMARELLLTGQKVVPTKLLNKGFVFTYPELRAALSAIEGH